MAAKEANVHGILPFDILAHLKVKFTQSTCCMLTGNERKPKTQHIQPLWMYMTIRIMRQFKCAAFLRELSTVMENFLKQNSITTLFVFLVSCFLFYAIYDSITTFSKDFSVSQERDCVK
ncbi:hypothetical protein GQX74_013253 [Glossina fuscipes]|nr:hypothetical protein GQX74_013253 [Glossina fuscipes]